MSDERPGRCTARKSFPRAEQQSRGNESDSSSSSTERDAKNSSAESRRNGSDSSSSSTEREEKHVRHTSAQSKRTVSKSQSVSPKRSKQDVENSTPPPVGKEAVESFEKGSEESRRNGSRSSSLSPVKRPTDAGSSSEQLRRSRSSLPSTQQQEMEAGSSSAQQIGNETTMPSVQRTKRDLSQSSAASTKRQKFDAGSSSSRSTLPQYPSTSTEGQEQCAGSSSAKPAENRALISFSRSEQPEMQSASPLKTTNPEKETSPGKTCVEYSNRYEEVTKIRGSKETIIRSSSSEDSDPPSSEHDQPDAGGSSDESNGSEDSSASAGKKRDVASSSSEKPMPSTSSSASRERQGHPSPPNGGSSPDKTTGSSSSTGREEQPGEPGDPDSPPRNIGPILDEDFIPSLPIEMLENIFSLVEVKDLRTCSRVSRAWKNVIFSLKVPWIMRCRWNDFEYKSEKKVLTPKMFRNLYLVTRWRMLPFDMPRGFIQRYVGCRYRRPRRLDEYDFYITIKAFHCNNNKLVVVSRDRYMRVFDMTEDRPLRISRIGDHTLDELISTIHCVRLTNINSHAHVLCLTDSGFLCICDAEDPENQVEEKLGRTPRRNRHSYNKGKLVKKLALYHNAESGEDNPVCFDLLQDTYLLVAIGMKGLVEIRNVFGTDGVVTARTNAKRKIIKVILAWGCLPEQQSASDEAKTEVERREPPLESSTKEPKEIFLFSLDRETVYVHTVKIDFKGNIPFPERAEATPITTIELQRPSPFSGVRPMFHYRPTLCFDGTTYLYFPDTFYGTPTQKIRRYNVQSRMEEHHTTTDGPVDQLLGAGKTYLAFITRSMTSTEVELFIKNRSTDKDIVRCRLPSDDFSDAEGYQRSSLHESLFGGECSWLGGFDGKNDTGLICVYQAGPHRLAYVKWRPRPSS